MKWVVYLALGLIGVGCVQFPIAGSKKSTPSAAEPHVSRVPPQVTADQVNELNARAKAAALQEELDRAASANALPGPDKPVFNR